MVLPQLGSEPVSKSVSFNMQQTSKPVSMFVNPQKNNVTIRRILTIKEFDELLWRVDANKDGAISQSELREALRELGLRFTTWRAWRARRHVDANKNGLIDGELERKALMEVLRNRWGIVVQGF